MEIKRLGRVALVAAVFTGTLIVQQPVSLAQGMPREDAPTCSAGEVTSRRTKDTKTVLNDDCSYTTTFGQGLHYEAAPGRWEEVDLRFRSDGEEFVMDRHNLIARVRGANIEISDRVSGDGIRWLTSVAPEVAGRSAHFSSRGLDWTYSTRNSGLKLAAVVHDARGPQTYEFRYQLLGGAADFTVDEDGNLISNSFVVPRATVLGANLEQYRAGKWQLLPGQRIAFEFDDSGLPAVAFPYELDPTTTFTVNASADDGTLHGDSTTYPPAAGTSTDLTSPHVTAGRSYQWWLSPPAYSVWLSVMRWNTSALPDDAILTSADLLVNKWYSPIYDTKTYHQDNRNLTADWHQVGGISHTTSFTPNAQTNALSGIPLRLFSNDSTQVDYLIRLANTNGVSKNGYSGLRLHVDGGQPTGMNHIYFTAYDDTSLPEPRLIVNYTINNPPSLTSATDSPDPVTAGNVVNFNVAWSDPNSGDTVRALICKTNAVASGSCSGAAWATGSLSATSPATASYTTSSADIGTKSYWAFACDQSTSCSSSASGTFQVLNHPPSLASATDSPDPVTAGNVVNFNLGWTDPNPGDSVRALICKTNAVASGSCSGGAWATGSLSATSPATASYTTSSADIGTKSYWAFACDQSTSCSSSVSGTFQVLNRPPVISFNVNPTSGDRSTIFNASFAGTTEPDNDTIYYRVNWGDGSNTYDKESSHRYQTAGTYTVSGFACDSFAACSSADRTVTVEFSNNPPSANLNVTPTVGDLRTTFSASVTGSDPDGDALSYEIDWGDGATTPGQNGTHQYEAPGRYTIAGVVTDAYGASGSATREVVVCAMYEQGQCVERPPRQDPPVPNLPREIAAPVANIVRMVPEVKDLEPSEPNDVMILDANLQQVYAESNDEYRDECTANADSVCDAPGRLKRFVKRIVTLVGKAGGDGMGNVAPDVILLQEVGMSHATRVANKLSAQLGFPYVALIGSEHPEVGDSPEVDDWCLQHHPANQAECKAIIKIKADSAIIYNDRVLNPTTTSYYDTKYDPDERCDRIGGQDIDGDDDGDPDCRWAKWKRHYLAGFDEHRVGRPNRLTGYTFAVASVHLVTVSHFKDDDQENESNVRHEEKKSAWAGEIADELALDYPLLDSYFIGGDLNVHRCRNKVRGAAGDFPESALTCEIRGWWTALSSRGFIDAILDRHDDDDSSGERIVPQYRDGKSGIAQSYRDKRIDYLFGSSAAIRRASFDLTCGESATGRIDKNCRDVRNPDFYSDHRLLWTLARDS